MELVVFLFVAVWWIGINNFGCVLASQLAGYSTPRPADAVSAIKRSQENFYFPA